MTSADPRDRILIVEDSPSTRMIARATIERLGLQVTEAASGTEALERFEAEQIALVLLDVGLPDLDGFAVTERIRAHDRGAHVPIIMLTGRDDVESIQRAFDVGATDFASKPVSWLILGQRLLFALESARRQHQIAAQREELEETQTLAKIGSWTYYVNDQRLDVSESCRRIFDLPEEADLARTVVDRIPEKELVHLRPMFDRTVTVGAPVEVKHHLRDSAGEDRVVYTHARRMNASTEDDIWIQGHSQDITVREEAEARVRYMAQHDSLTGLKNQDFFREHLAVMLAQQRRDDVSHALLLVNLDNFSRINDIHGRETGDAILRTTAERLAEAIRDSDMITSGVPIKATIARVGGDEFSVVIVNMRTPADIARVAVRLIETVRQPITVGNDKFNLTGRIGIAIAPEDGNEIGVLIANADAACRHAGRAGGNGYEFYRSTMNESARNRLGLESDFREALVRKQVQVRYQPRVDMRTGIVCAAEALARWHHEESGWVPPTEFVQLAEESGLTFDFGRLIIESVMEQMKTWRVEGYDPVSISINISPTLLVDDRLPALMQELMDANGVDPRLVELEITESVLIRREEDAAIALDKLKALGVSVALDDFGTGYSALTHLQHFPVDVIKIDRSFVDAMSEERGRAIVRGVISMAHAMGLRVVAEGVESLDQRAFLAAEGCDEEQGYLVSKPIPADEFERLFWPEGDVPILMALAEDEDG